MTEFIENIFSSVFGNNVILATILIAIVPIIELKGAIPFSMSPEIWGSFALSYWEAFAYALIGGAIIVPILALIYKPIINLLKKTKLFRKLAEKLENRVNKRKDKIENKIEQNSSKDNVETNANVDIKKEEQVEVKPNKTIYNKKFFIKLFSVFAFVAIPLPLTGIWTGTCLAVALGLNFWWTCASVITGNVVAGLLITLASTLFGDSTMIFVYILFAIIIAFFVFYLIKKLIKKAKKTENN